MTEERPNSHPSWLRIGMLGCGGAVAVAGLFLAGIAGLTFWGYKSALEVREEVDRQFGGFDSYNVPADGTIPADRMARFLAIRRALMTRCPEVTEVTGSFRAVDEMAGQEKPDVGDLFGRVGRVIRHVPSLGFVFGEYVSDRNNALRDNQMGLGEYTWIYVTSYFGYLNQPPRRVLDEQNRKKVFEDRVYPEIASVIERHINAAGLGDGPWVEELARLRADRNRVPLRGALPPELAGSIAPYRDALTAAACPAAAELDVTLTVRRSSFGYDHR